MTKLTENVFAAVRLSKYSGKEYLDTLSISLDRRDAQHKAKASDLDAPIWAKDNPIIRIVRCKLVEVEE